MRVDHDHVPFQSIHRSNYGASLTHSGYAVLRMVKAVHEHVERTAILRLVFQMVPL